MKHSKDQFGQVETERLIIRTTQLTDEQFIYDLLNTPNWIRYIGDRKIKTLQDASAYIENRMLSALREFGFSNNTIIRKSDQRKIGVCGLYKKEGLEYHDIGFALFPEFEGQGYALEACDRLIDYSRQKFNIKQIQAITLEENTASQKLLKRLGFTHQGAVFLEEEGEELLLYLLDD